MRRTFVVGTGRCGSLTAAYIAATAVEAVRHEGWDDAIPLAYAAHTRQLRSWEIHDYVDDEYGDGLLDRVEVDFKQSLLIPWLATVRDAQFVWLLRDPWETVASMQRAGWYEPGRDPDDVYVRYEIRPHGPLTSEAVTPHDLRCWWWRYCNEVVFNDLQRFRAPTMAIESSMLADPTVRAEYREFVSGGDVEGPGPNLRTSHQRPLVTADGTRVTLPRVELTAEQSARVGELCGDLWSTLKGMTT